MRLFCFGCGYTAEALVAPIWPRATISMRRHQTRLAGRRANRAAAWRSWPSTGDRRAAPRSRALLDEHHATCWSASRPISRATRCCATTADDLAELPTLAWVGYLSTVGVYGDCQGAWVDETSADAAEFGTQPAPRCEAEQAWLAFGRETRAARRDFPPRRHLRARAQRHRQPARAARAQAHHQARAGLQSHPRRRHRTRAGRGHRHATRAIASTTSATTSRRRRRTWWPMPPSCLGLAAPPEIPFEAGRADGHGGKFLVRKPARVQRSHSPGAGGPAALSQLPGGLAVPAHRLTRGDEPLRQRSRFAAKAAHNSKDGPTSAGGGGFTARRSRGVGHAGMGSPGADRPFCRLRLRHFWLHPARLGAFASSHRREASAYGSRRRVWSTNLRAKNRDGARGCGAGRRAARDGPGGTLAAG